MSLKTAAVALMEAEAQFETDLFWAVAEGDFEVIPIPCSDGSELSETEKVYIANLAEKHKVKLLYNVKLKDYSIVFGIEGHKIGIIPNNYKQFSC